jgi:hypothetical protein
MSFTIYHLIQELLNINLGPILQWYDFSKLFNRLIFNLIVAMVLIN